MVDQTWYTLTSEMKPLNRIIILLYSFAAGHNCNPDSDSSSLEYEEDHFGDFIEFKKQLKTNTSFLAEVFICPCGMSVYSDFILKALKSFKVLKILKLNFRKAVRDDRTCPISCLTVKVHQ